MSLTGPPGEDLDSATTFPQFIRAAAAAYGDAPAISMQDETAQALSFRDLDDQSAELARALLARGVGKGSRIGFICGNGPFFALAFAAIGRIGAVAIPISTLIKADELVRVLRQSDAAGLIVQRSLLGHDLVERLAGALPALREASGPDLRLPRAPYLRWIASTGDHLPPAFLDLRTLTQAAASVDDALLREVEAEIHAEDQLVEIYTSGSMALPKGVKHNHGAVMFRARYIANVTGRARGMEMTVPLPMFWVGGMGMFLLPNWWAGAHSICTEATRTDSRTAMGSVLTDDALAAMAGVRPYWALGMSETFGPYS
ncbi:MAG TPA: class I adenylate-forming enzyme family protein, partial [Sphingobium sp.]